MRTITEVLTAQQEARLRLPEIVALIEADIEADATLSDLTSDSKTADFREWEYVMAACSWITEALWDESKSELNEIASRGIAANQFWFQREWKKFQYGDDLIVNDLTGKYSYAVVDPTKQIIKKLAIVKGTFNWIVKVATEISGSIEPLTSDQLTAFRSFIDLTQPPGPKIPVVSLNADLIDSRFTIYYNPIKPLSIIQPLVETAYLDYIDSIDLEQESVYYITRHIDAIQRIENIVDVQPNSIEAKENGGTFDVVARIYKPISGYLKKEPSLDLSTALTFVAVI